MKFFINCVTALLIVSACARSYAQTNCAGKVIDAATNEPVAQASIQIKNTNQGTITNNKGEFTLPLSDTANELVISSLG